jgi:DMSO/TMAO reductase YedYZ molybdopterin-dependent catalytic subunit
MAVPSRRTISTAVIALAAGFGGVAGSFAAVGLTREFVPQPIARALTDVLPARAIGAFVAQFGLSGQFMNLLLATGLTAVVLAGLAALGIAVGRTVGLAPLSVPLTIVGCWAVATALTGHPIASLAVGLGSGIVVGISELARHDVGPIAVSEERRSVVAGSISALGLGAIGLSIGPRPQIESENVDAVTNPDGQSGDGTEMSVPQLRELASERSLGVGSIEPLLSENHYTVDINTIDPTVNRDNWTLTVTGAVEEEVELDYEDIRQLPAENQITTLRCVGDSLNGTKIDTAIWTGVPVSEILDQAVPDADCDCVMLRAADDFYQEFPLSALEDGLLAYGMNGETVPRSHGYPLRALVPGHWGEVNVKWLTEIEVLEREQQGYWEERGWHGTGPVHTVAKLWDDNDLDGIVHNDDGTIQLAGHAYAGTRGIDRVEVSTDGGESWTDAELTEPLPGENIWRQWSHTYEPPDSEHEVVVRATDGEGNLQTEAESQTGAYPNGATGWVRQTVQP